ncbi:958_t:CDS:2 [Funneliformis mosseae]|uniref:Histone acetyltransferase n=1 Tax=Funneliformis mosseae TaxID=27381 RepID=A0A9N9A8F2_FUNMO|nr:958_t:CDS:2 [Funneliformis mosseae]
MATLQKRRNGRRNNQDETPNKLKKKSSKVTEQIVATQDETPVSNVVVPVDFEEKIKPINNGISSSPPSPQNEQASSPAVTPSKKNNTPKKRKVSKPPPVEEVTLEDKSETISLDQTVIEQPVLSIKKEKGSSIRKRNRILPQRGKKINSDTQLPQTPLQTTTQLQNEIPQERPPPPSSQPQLEIQKPQKTRGHSTQKRKVKAPVFTVSVVTEKEDQKPTSNAVPIISPEEASTSTPRVAIKEEPKEINEITSQKRPPRIVVKPKRKRIIKSKETISSDDEDLDEEPVIPNNIMKAQTISESSGSLNSQSKLSKKRGNANGTVTNKDAAVKTRITRQRTKTTNKGKTGRGRRKLIRLDDDDIERDISKFSDAETIKNETDEKLDQLINHISDNRQTVESGEQEREQAAVVNLPFGGRLTTEEADTSKTRPDNYDKVRFENAKNKAEAAMQPRQEITFDIEDQPQIFADATPKIRSIRFGDWEMDTWYVAPYPEEYSWYPTLYICEYCLKYMKSKYIADRHKMKCPMKHPPGDEIYRDGQISIFEVDGRKNTIYCQNLCLLAKMFLDHKTLYYDVEPFLFYVMTEINDMGCHFVGYFSKEKRSPLNYNVSCILTLPIHQRKGYGNLLIEFSYLLTKRENKTGSPEKPLSDLGLLSYRYYWRNVLFEVLNNSPDALKLSRATSMTVNDIIATLQINNMLVRDEENGTYRIVVDKDLIKNHLDKVTAKGYPRIKSENLRWTPFILTRVLRRVQDLENEKSLDMQEQQNPIDRINKSFDENMDADD